MLSRDAEQELTRRITSGTLSARESCQNKSDSADLISTMQIIQTMDPSLPKYLHNEKATPYVAYVGGTLMHAFYHTRLGKTASNWRFDQDGALTTDPRQARSLPMDQNRELLLIPSSFYYWNGGTYLYARSFPPGGSRLAQKGDPNVPQRCHQ